MKLKKIILLVFILLTAKSYSQGQSVISEMAFQQSPFLQGAGATGTAVITYEPTGFYYNPAILGFNAKTNHMSILFFPKKIKNWWDGWYTDISINTLGLNIGYNFGKIIPISVGIGFIHNYYNYDFFLPDRDYINTFSIGASLNYPVSFGLGFSIKNYNSTLGNFTASGIAYDIGAILDVPIDELLLKNVNYDLNKTFFLTPKVDFVLGYSLSNVGNEVSYVDPAQADPLPRTARLGYSFNLGINLNMNNKCISAFSYTFVAEASDQLPERDSNSNTSYKGLLGDINVGENLIQLKYSNNTMIHKAHIFNALETVKIAFGNFHSNRGPFISNSETSATSFSTKGIFKLINNNANNSLLKFITKHIGIEYTMSKVFKDTSMETKYSAISIFFNNFEL